MISELNPCRVGKSEALPINLGWANKKTFIHPTGLPTWGKVDLFLSVYWYEYLLPSSPCKGVKLRIIYHFMRWITISAGSTLRLLFNFFPTNFELLNQDNVKTLLC